MKDLNIKHPIVQFFAVGLVLFVLNHLFTVHSNDTDRVVITDDMLQEGIKNYESIWGEYPDSVMLGTILDNEVEKEVLYRKGLELQLDKNNDAIREELAMAAKQYLMAEADLTDPGDEVLRNYYQSHLSVFSTPELFDFDQYYFGDNEQMANESKKKADKGIRVKGIEGSGMKLNYSDASLAEVATTYGIDFSNEVASLAPGGSGVVQSIWGWHLILLKKVREGSVMDFETKRNNILTSWRAEEQKAYLDSVLKKLKGKVVVELSNDSTSYLNKK